MTWLPFESSRPRAAALAVVAIALAAGVALMFTSSSGPARRATASPRPVAGSVARREPASPRPVAGGFPHTPAGAAAAATAWLQGAPDALTNGTWDATVSAFVTPTFQAVARRADPGAALMQSRLNAPHAPPFVVRIWPLGFAVSQYSPTSARVRVWQLGVLEIARPTDVIGYTTTTVSLQWLGGDWKIAGILHGPALTPPGSTSTATEVTAWIAAVKQLHSYSYAP